MNAILIPTPRDFYDWLTLGLLIMSVIVTIAEVLLMARLSKIANLAANEANRISKMEKTPLLINWSMKCNFSIVKSVSFSGLPERERNIVSETLNSAKREELLGCEYALYNLCFKIGEQYDKLLLNPVITLR